MANVLRCPNCGCNDLEKTEADGLWGAPVDRCNCRFCGCRFEVAAAELPTVDYAVKFVSIRCPSCDSKATKTTSTRRKQGRPTVRYHRCEDCRRPFKSVEAA